MCCVSRITTTQGEDGHHPESYRVLKDFYEGHIEGKHVSFERYAITP